MSAKRHPRESGEGVAGVGKVMDDDECQQVLFLIFTCYACLCTGLCKVCRNIQSPSRTDILKGCTMLKIL